MWEPSYESNKTKTTMFTNKRLYKNQTRVRCSGYQGRVIKIINTIVVGEGTSVKLYKALFVPLLAI